MYISMHRDNAMKETNRATYYINATYMHIYIYIYHMSDVVYYVLRVMYPTIAIRGEIQCLLLEHMILFRRHVLIRAL